MLRGDVPAGFARGAAKRSSPKARPGRFNRGAARASRIVTTRARSSCTCPGDSRHRRHGRQDALRLVLAEARPRATCLSLWHLLTRLPRHEAAPVYDRLAVAAPPAAASARADSGARVRRGTPWVSGRCASSGMRRGAVNGCLRNVPDVSGQQRVSARSRAGLRRMPLVHGAVLVATQQRTPALHHPALARRLSHTPGRRRPRRGRAGCAPDRLAKPAGAAVGLPEGFDIVGRMERQRVTSWTASAARTQSRRRAAASTPPFCPDSRIATAPEAFPSEQIGARQRMRPSVSATRWRTSYPAFVCRHPVEPSHGSDRANRCRTGGTAAEALPPQAGPGRERQPPSPGRRRSSERNVGTCGSPSAPSGASRPRHCGCHEEGQGRRGER